MSSLPSLSDEPLYHVVRHNLRLARRFRALLDEALEHDLSLNTKELLVLGSVMDGYTSPGSVAERHFLPAPSVTRIVNKLVERGLLERGSHPVDLRRSVLRLTPAGEELRGRGRHFAADQLRGRYAALPAEVLLGALKALQDLEGALDAAETLPSAPAQGRAGAGA